CFRVFEAGARLPSCADEPSCVFAAREVPPERAKPEEVAGELVAVRIDPETARIRNTPLKKLLTGWESWNELQKIQRVKGYKSGWAWHVAQEQPSRLALRTMPRRSAGA